MRVLKEKNVDKKEEIVCVSGNKGVRAETLVELVSRERHGPAVASTAGQYFEKSALDQSTPEVVRLVARRPDIGSQALAYAALSPKASQLIVGFAGSAKKEDQRIAARMLAATALMRDPQGPAKKKLAEKRGDDEDAKLNVDYRVEIEKLLNTTQDEVALEYLLLTVGVDRVMAVKDAIGQHAGSKNKAVAMAAQYALASTKQSVDEAAILRAITTWPKQKKARPALSYDPRQTPRIYAMMAAGEAKLDSAREPLLELVTDKDLHNAVYATRALSQIGGEGLATQVLSMMNEDTPWPVRVAIYDAAGANPDKAAVALLQNHFNDENGRFRQDALYALLSIAAGQAQGMTIEAFNEWWSISGDDFEVDPKATRKWRSENAVGDAQVEPIAGFYESGIISERPVFSVDASKSMKGAQIESLKQTLNEVVSSFPARVKFNIVDFGGHVRTLAPGGMIPAKNRKQAMEQFTYEIELTLGTRTYDAIERAMNIPDMDSVHFLSDGAPYGSHLKSWSRIDHATRLFCSTAPIAVHVIYYPEPGRKVKEKTVKPIRKYAKAHAGGFFVIESE